MAKHITKYIKNLVTGPQFYMGGGSSKPAKAPDPYKTADAQYKQNVNQAAYEAKLNRYAYSNPLGTVSWKNSGTDKAPNWSQTIALSPEQQKLYDTQMGTQSNLATQASDYADRLHGMLESDPEGGDLQTRQHVEDALMQRLNPYLAQDQQALQTQLANQGLTYGGEAYQKAMMDQSQRVNDARLAVISQAGDEMARSQSMENLRRNQGIGELSALMQGSGNVTLPQYEGATTISGGNAPDVAGLINANYQNQLAASGAGQAGKNGLLGGMGSALGSFAGSKFSDARLKENITPAGEKNGFNLYDFNYIGEPDRYRGVMAQEVAETMPEAVTINDGYLMVDYSMLGFDMERIDG